MKHGYRVSGCLGLFWPLSLLVLWPIALTSAQVLPTNTYYTSTTNATGAALKSALHGIIRSHTVIPYSGSGFDTADALKILDADPVNSNNVILIYSGFSLANSSFGGSSGQWNREHVWPQAFGVDSGNQNSDLFNLRACDGAVNNTRGNLYYDKTTTPSNTLANAPGSSYDSDSWEPRDADKGYVARDCFYLTTCYNGTGGDSNLQLADSPNAGANIFARLTTLLDWNRRFPPADSERIRNGVIDQLYQHNRNPFIDNPDFADMVFLGADGFAAWQGMHFTSAEVSNATISATAADPDGDGVPNVAEYALGHDPHVAEANPIQSLTLQTVGGTNFLYLTHHRNHYLSGVTLTYQTATNLPAWTDTSAETLSTTQIDPQKDLVTVRLVARDPQTFVRLKAHRIADVASGDILDVSPFGSLVSSGNTGGPFSPTGQTYTVSNIGDSNLNWSASAAAGWLTLSATSGTLAPSASTTVTVSINANANSLAPGFYSDTVFFNNTTSGNGNTTRSVTLTVINLAPVIVTNGAIVLVEDCSPANGSIDPAETVTVSFSLKNVGSGDTSNLVATLVASDNVISPSGAQTYGVVTAGGSAVAQSFTFTAAGTCGETVAATLHLQDGPTDLGSIDYTFALGQTSTTLTQNFDGVTAPSLPSGWTTSATGVQSNWVTSTTSASSSPNAAFSPDTPGIGVNELDSPSIAINSASAQLTFRQNYSLTVSTTNSTLGYDGGVLEIAISGGGFQDIVTAGGSFVSGGYNATLSSDYSNPLAGRQAWSGNSVGFITTTVNLPSAAAGQTVQLRWRCGTGDAPPASIGSSGTLAYWDFDALSATPNTVAANLSVTPVTTTNASGAVTYFGGNPSSGKAIAASGFTTSAGPPTTSFSAFAFALTATNSSPLSLSNISFDDQHSGTGPVNFSVQVSQLSNFSTNIYDSGAITAHTAITNGANTFTLSNSNLTGTVYFRLYAYQAGAAGGTWRIDNLNIQGTTVSAGATIGTGWYIDSISINDTTCCVP